MFVMNECECVYKFCEFVVCDAFRRRFDRGVGMF